MRPLTLTGYTEKEGEEVSIDLEMKCYFCKGTKDKPCERCNNTGVVLGCGGQILLDFLKKYGGHS